jgi:hypothetical protein
MIEVYYEHPHLKKNFGIDVFDRGPMCEMCGRIRSNVTVNIFDGNKKIKTDLCRGCYETEYVQRMIKREKPLQNQQMRLHF